ncbi:MAG: hypothetical protein ACRYGF_19460 [Janthinobacterium lividum]
MLKTLRSYLFWTYERGSFHYDVMVTLILLFIFVTPHFINYRDRPVYQLPSQIMVENDGSGELVYQVRETDVQQSLTHVKGPTDDLRTRRALRRLIEPIAGDVLIERYEPLPASNGGVGTYRVWAHR